MFSNPSWAVTVPSGGSPGFGDEIRSSDGVSCRNGNSGPRVELGAAAENQEIGGKDTIAYARLSFSLDRKPSVDCSALYNLELDRLKFELQELKERSKKKTGTITIE